MTPANYNPTTWNWGYIANEAATFGLELLGAIVIFIIGYFVAKFLADVLDKVLKKVGFDRLLERGGIRKAMQGSGYDPARVVSQLVFYALMLWVVAFALGVFGSNPISDLCMRILAFAPNILVAIAVVAVAAAVGALVRDLITDMLGRVSYGNVLANVAYVGILMLGLFMALTQLNIALPIVVGLWYAMLALAVGVGIVAIGGGGIKPMEERWRRTLDRADRELPRVTQQVQQQAVNQQGTTQPGYVQPGMQPGYAATNQPVTPNMYPNQPGVVYPQNMPTNPQMPNNPYDDQNYSG